MKAFIIAMLQSEHSLELAHDCVDAAKHFGVDVALHPAVNGFECDEKFKEYGIKRLLTSSIADSPGNKGCFLSHFELWNLCVELNETILILEHDGKLIRELPVNIEDNFTEVLNLDPNREFSNPTYNKLVTKSLKDPVDYFYTSSKKKSEAGSYIIGAHGYCIKPQGAMKLIRFAQQVGALPTDKHIGKDVVDLKSTTVTVVGLHDFYIDNNMKKFSSTKNLQKFLH